jgi:hypothetical protein
VTTGGEALTTGGTAASGLLADATGAIAPLLVAVPDAGV